MSKRAESLVWERSRMGKSDLLMLVKIADLSDDEGRNAWPEVPGLMRYCRSSERATQYTLQRLERKGEIEIEYNDGGRVIELRGGRTFRPKWFIHVRCVCDWEAYQTENVKPATSAGFARGLQTGRPRRKPATLADSTPFKTRNSCTRNPQNHVEKPATSGSAYKEGSVNDPLVELEQGAAPPLAPETARRTDDDDPNFRVILKSAHDALDVDGIGAPLSQLTATTRSLCRARQLNVGESNELVNKAIDAALWQRTHPSRPAVRA